MVTSEERPVGSSESGLQDVEVRGVQEKSDGDGAHDGGARRLNIRVVLFHHAHVTAGRARDRGCGFCRHGMESVLVPVKEEGVEGGVVQSTGVDEKGAATPTSHPWWYR